MVGGQVPELRAAVRQSSVWGWIGAGTGRPAPAMRASKRGSVPKQSANRSWPAAVRAARRRNSSAARSRRRARGATAYRRRGPGGTPRSIRRWRSMATVMPSSSTLAIWVIDSSDVAVPVNSRAATAAARSGWGRRTVIVCTMRGVRGAVVRPGPARPVRSWGTLRTSEEQLVNLAAEARRQGLRLGIAGAFVSLCGRSAPSCRACCG